MKDTRILMGMPVTVEITETKSEAVHKERHVSNGHGALLEMVYAYFDAVDHRFSTYKEDSEISAINSGTLTISDASAEMQEIFRLAEDTKQQSRGFFDIRTAAGKYDPSGIVKGWAIRNAAQLLDAHGCTDYYVEAGGDIQVRRDDSAHEPWSVGIRNPFNINEIVKVVHVRSEGVATSGTYIRGQHIYNPFDKSRTITDIVSLTVIGPNIYDADRYATAAFAMGASGINYIERLPGFEGYLIDAQGIATMTTGFSRYTASL